VDRLTLLESGKNRLGNISRMILTVSNSIQFVEAAKEKEMAKSTQPSGQGDTFTPGEWNPSSKR
jgi:hypothetical protein